MNWYSILSGISSASPTAGIQNVIQNPTSMFTNPTSPILGYPINESWNNLLNPTGVTDALGLTDTKAGERGLAELEDRSQRASDTLDQNLLGVNQMYSDAVGGRTMGEVLDNYNTGTQNALNDYLKNSASAYEKYNTQMQGTENAASEDNVRQFLNPMYSRAIQNATNQALAGAGSSLQSSAANQAVGTAVGNQVTDMWNQAFNEAMADAQNKQGVYGNTYGAATNTLNNAYGNTVNLANQTANMNLMPSLNWAQLTSDVAGTKYTKDMDLAQAAAQVAGQNQSWLGNFF